MAAPSRSVGPRPIAREARDRARKRSRPIRVTVVPAAVRGAGAETPRPSRVLMAVVQAAGT
jgi:hypothetical protein